MDHATIQIIARCRLGEAKRWFMHLKWEILPQNERGQRIVRWGADHAWMAADKNPARSLQRWCRKWAPWLTPADLDDLKSYTQTSNKRWSADQCSAVLGISVRKRTILKFRHLGANNDPNYEIRLGIKREKGAQRSRKYRDLHSSGKKPGRPPLELSADEALARRRNQQAERAKRYRASRKNASRVLSDIDDVTEFSVTGIDKLAENPATCDILREPH